MVLAPAVVPAQSVDDKIFLSPPADAWLTYHGEYNGQRHSKLTQITPENVGKLKQVWRFQTGQTQAIKASPILKDGVIYLTLPDHIWASMRGRPRRSGTMSTPRIAPSISAIGAPRCTRTRFI